MARCALEAGRRDLVDRLDEVERRARQAQLTVVVLGEFSSGKSSLLNAVLADATLLPVDSYVSTRVLTSVRWAERETVTVELAARDAGATEEHEVGRDGLRGYVCEAEVQDGTAAADAERVLTASIRTPNAKLRDGIVCVDTPGIGGVHRGHTAAALGVLPQADLVLYVIDALRLPLPSETAFIERVVRALGAEEHPERLLFAVTKADQAADPAQAVRDVRARLSAVAGIEERSPVLAVSSRSRLLQLTGAQPPGDSLTGFQEFEARLWQGVGHARLRLRAGAALAELDAVVRGLTEPVEEAVAVLEAQDTAAREKLAGAGAARQAEAGRLGEGSAIWQTDLDAAFADVTAALRARSDAALAKAWRDLRARYRTDAAFLDDPQRVLDELAERLAVLVGELGRAATELTSAACAGVAERSGVPLRSPMFADLPVPPLPDPLTVPAPSATAAPSAVTSLTEAFEAATRGARLGVARGGEVGAIAWDQAVQLALPGGSRTVKVVRGVVQSAAEGGGAREPSPGVVAGRVVGGLVGAVMAFVGQVRELRAATNSDQVAALDRLFMPWEAQQRDFLHGAAQELVDVCAARARAELRDRIAQLRAECETARTEVAAALEAARRDADAARAPLAARRDALKRIDGDLTSLVDELRVRLAAERD
ncbi:dynamin family protein [Streptomyces spectabilis]|uniref:dynamin family protein n=1 Tax=Streptomyces spectabilis TaxID=68270 RepID=UPI00137665B8|nr:dynamin family protein [Streptomyces spectabilis]